MKEQLVEMTGLSPRVIRVWFQNKRCKDKKRSLALKQLHQQQQNKVAQNKVEHHSHTQYVIQTPLGGCRPPDFR